MYLPSLVHEGDNLKERFGLTRVAISAGRTHPNSKLNGFLDVQIAVEGQLDNDDEGGNRRLQGLGAGDGLRHRRVCLVRARETERASKATRPGTLFNAVCKEGPTATVVNCLLCLLYTSDAADE